jgi:hypothetical protein
VFQGGLMSCWATLYYGYYYIGGAVWACIFHKAYLPVVSPLRFFLFALFLCFQRSNNAKPSTTTSSDHET